MKKNKIKILFFLGSLRAGGKERRMLELLDYLKKNTHIELMVVVTEDTVDFPYFFEMGVGYKVIKKSWEKGDITVFYKLYKICQEFKPHLIHSWGPVQSFYAFPTAFLRKIPLINSQITSAPPAENIGFFTRLMDKINFKFSKIIISNSKAGLRSFKPPMENSLVIYNGINLNRFENLPDKALIKGKYGINTPYSVVMIASLGPNKDYRMFYRLAQKVLQIRKDVTFIGAGAYIDDDPVYFEVKEISQKNPNIIFSGRTEEAEALINACDIGVLFSPNGEGISNAIMEYMALSKPVIANDAGGTSELIIDKHNGYLVQEQSEDAVVRLILDLLNDAQKRRRFGMNGREIIENNFSLNKMGEAFLDVYSQVLKERIEKKVVKKNRNQLA